MNQGSDGAPRRLRLNRETLRDLSPTDEQAAAVQGGTLSGATVCLPCVPPDLEELRRRTGTGITIGDCQPGKWKVEHRIRTEFEVLEDGAVIIRNLHTSTGDLEELEEFRPID